jgi:TonB family protein
MNANCSGSPSASRAARIERGIDVGLKGIDMDFSAALLQYLAGVSLRVLPVAAAAMAVPAALRIRAAATRHAVWTVVAAGMLLSAALSPVLPPLRLPILPAAAHASLQRPPGPWIAERNWRPYAAALYLAGLLFFATRLAFSYLFTRRLMRASRPLSPELAQDVFESTWITVPMTAGWLRPRIFLPAAWPRWEPAKLHAVLTHERVHVRRADWAIGAMAAVNRCVFWFHPLAWWLERKLALLAEEACDDAALLLLGEREHYAQALLDMAAAVKSGHGRLVWEAMAMAKASEVKHRIDLILDETRQIPRGLTRPRLAALLACSLPLVYVSLALQLAPAPVRAQEPQPRAVVYSNQGYAFLNTRAEATALEQQLKTNPEDQQARGRLLGYYFQNAMRGPQMEHVLWLIQNHPESDLLDMRAVISPTWDGPGAPAEYQRASALWREQISRHLNDARVLGNAAQFFSDPAADPAEAERLLQQARTLEPGNRDWLSRLTGLYVNSITTANRAATNPGFAKHSNPQFAADATLRLENSSDGALLASVGRALSSYEVGPGQSRAAALANVSPGLTPLWELGDRLQARAVQFGAPRRVSANSAEPNIRRVAPVYPPLALQARIQGVVWLNVTLAQEGTVREVHAASGHPLLVPSAIDAVKQWTFGPQAAGTQLEVEVPFQLPEGARGNEGSRGNEGPRGAAPDGWELPELQPVTRVDPVYPPLARQARISGVVHLIATVGVDGHVVDLKAAGGHPLLVPAALAAAREWTYAPQREPTKTRMEIQFHLNQ